MSQCQVEVLKMSATSRLLSVLLSCWVLFLKAGACALHSHSTSSGAGCGQRPGVVYCRQMSQAQHLHSCSFFFLQIKYGDTATSEGVLFATYSALIGESQAGGQHRTRLKQILDWCRENFDGVVSFKKNKTEERRTACLWLYFAREQRARGQLMSQGAAVQGSLAPGVNI